MFMFRSALGVLGFVLVILSGLMLLPTLMVFTGDGENARGFLVSFSITSVTGLTLLLTCRRAMQNPNPRKMFLITALCWIGVSFFSAIPLMLSNYPLSVTDALFEAVSGITTTGSTVMTGLDATSRDLLLWRSLMQWVGGVGVIAMAVAILPFLGVGAMRLFRTESSDWSDKVVARGSNQLKYILITYLVLSIVCATYYFVCGMNWFDAINHMMTTLSTGGYSTSDESIGHFPSLWVQWGAVLFMLIGGLPFTLYIQLVLSGASRNMIESQVSAFLFMVVVAGLLMSAYLILTHEMNPQAALTSAFVNTTSIITTTGYATEDYGAWGTGSLAIFFFLIAVGGCSGSTSGGVKIFRFQLLWLFLKEHVTQAIHPRAVIALQYNRRSVDPDVISSLIAFLAMVTVTYIVITLVLALSGLDLVTSSSGALTAIMNVGPGLGEIIGPAGTFQSLPDVTKWTLCAGMLLGRLEYLTLFVLMAPAFWRD